MQSTTPYPLHDIIIQGCANVACSNESYFAAAIAAAQNADVVILVMGLDNTVEGVHAIMIWLLPFYVRMI